MMQAAPVRKSHQPPTLFDNDGRWGDNFAGGGGATLGMERARGRSIDFAVNHDAEAVGMHRINHPHTYHLCQDVMDDRVFEHVRGQRVRYVHFSPDCTHHSKAKGGKPLRDKMKKSRDGAWVMIRWAGTIGPDVMTMEASNEPFD